MVFWTDDPVADAYAYDRECQENLNKYPKCYHCEKPITDEHFYMINDEKVCEECLNDLYRETTEDYIQEDE